MKKYNVSLIGATGLVGRTFLKVLEEYDLPINELKIYASNKSLGKELIYNNKKYECRVLNDFSYKNVDFAIFCAGKDIAKQHAKKFEDGGAIVIDNSSQFRMEKDISLIVPEINMNSFYKSKRNIIANPNCSTIQSVLPLFALSKKFEIKKIIYNTYQSISGAGQKAINDYFRLLNNKDNIFFPYDITKTCIPQIDDFLENGYTKEEIKMINETRKILNDYDIKISATCVRVPVLYSHAVSILVELNNDFNIDEIYDLFDKQVGLKVIDKYPTSIHSTGNDFVYVGRIRKDLSNKNTLLFYTVSDNIRKGAASNVVQIMNTIIKN